MFALVIVMYAVVNIGKKEGKMFPPKSYHYRIKKLYLNLNHNYQYQYQYEYVNNNYTNFKE